MKTLVFIISIIATGLSIGGCGWEPHILKSTGDMVTIVSSVNIPMSVELIEVQDSVLLIELEAKQASLPQQQRKEIASIDLAKVKRITVEGYEDRSWGTSLLTFQVIPSILMGIASASSPNGNFALGFMIFGVPTLITYVALEASTPSNPEFTSPFTNQNLMNLKKYARYPRELNPRQRQRLLESYQQVKINELH